MQSVRSLLACGAYELAGHDSHTSDVAPTVLEYLPLPQSVQSSEPVPILYVPATHAVHVPPSLPVKPASQMQSVRSLLAWGASELAGHASHTSDVAPTVDEYLPLPQSVHVSEPVLILYFPATHAVQVPPSLPVKPALQVQSVWTVLPWGEFALLGQLVQVPAPDVLLYLPAEQLVHNPPSGPLEPMLHVHALTVVLPLGDVDCEGQVVQAAEPAPALYVPAVHSLHEPPLLPVYPALHAQAVEEVLPSGASAFAGQFVHAPAPDTAL